MSCGTAVNAGVPMRPLPNSRSVTGGARPCSEIPLHITVHVQLANHGSRPAKAEIGQAGAVRGDDMRRLGEQLQLGRDAQLA